MVPANPAVAAIVAVGNLLRAAREARVHGRARRAEAEGPEPFDRRQARTLQPHVIEEERQRLAGRRNAQGHQADGRQVQLFPVGEVTGVRLGEAREVDLEGTLAGRHNDPSSL